MRPPSENFRNSASTFHSMSVGGRLLGLLKKISYSIFSRRSCVSRTFSSSSVVTQVSTHSLVETQSRTRGSPRAPKGRYLSKGGGRSMVAGGWPLGKAGVIQRASSHELRL